MTQDETKVFCFFHHIFIYVLGNTYPVFLRKKYEREYQMKLDLQSTRSSLGNYMENEILLVNIYFDSRDMTSNFLF